MERVLTGAVGTRRFQALVTGNGGTTTQPLTVIIPTYRRGRAAVELARTLEPQLGRDDGMIIIWQGDAPAPPAPDRVRVITSNPPHLPRARNAGLRSTEAGVVLFLDDDIMPHDGLLEGHRRAYEDREVGAVAGYVDDPLFTTPRSVPSSLNEQTGEIRQYFMCGESQDSASVMGANMSFRREVIAAVGGFDEFLTRNAVWEDVDAAFRVRKAGWRIRYVAEARVRHNRAADGGCRSDHGARYVYHLFANTAHFFARHGDRQYRRGWHQYWWYRLEHLSRRGNRLVKHDPVIVAAGIAGWVAGTVRPVRMRPMARGASA